MHPATVLGAMVMAAVLPVAAHASADLAKAKNCMACHGVDKKLVGPAFKDVAAKYKGDKGAAAKLSQSIVKGSSGTWGPIPMPPNAISEADASALAKWVLAL
ncbi:MULTISPECIES: c-type cytochrome [Cupriavidus]|uniref:Cytochrome C n=1 Tax=Cupriavidus pauculus TaxID=82633 RepID=A0A3G8GZC8_9BURK|nr:MULTISPECIES: c-type cytochrome [Cupriavidus]AZG13300.1 cytochrome C [Cupriavidus pauculus]MDT6964470.1 c-type cytochrome [Cupriavidus sp. SZY C1]